MGDHSQRRERRQLGDQLAGQAGDEELERGIAREIRKRQHRDRGLRERARPLDRRDETISAARGRLDVAGCVGAVAERFPEMGQAGVEGPFVLDHHPVAPKVPPDLVARHELTRASREKPQEAGRLRSQPDPLPVLPQFSRSRVQLEGPETDYVRHLASRGCGIVAPSGDTGQARLFKSLRW